MAVDDCSFARRIDITDMEMRWATPRAATARRNTEIRTSISEKPERTLARGEITTMTRGGRWLGPASQSANGRPPSQSEIGGASVTGALNYGRRRVVGIATFV